MLALGNNVLVLMPPPIEKTEGDIVLPESSKQFSNYGLVLSKGEKVPDTIRAGDYVTFERASCSEIRMTTLQRDDPNREIIAIGYSMLSAVFDKEYASELGLHPFDDVEIQHIADETTHAAL